jgi:hypothetical protein
MGSDSRLSVVNGVASTKDERSSTTLSAIALLIWLLAGAVAFLPFAFDTSPLDAVMLHVPGNQGNWWHFLAGAPFFLAFPMIWLRLRVLFSAQPSTPIERRVIWIAAGLSVAGTLAVQTPFLLHLAGTSNWQSFSILSLGLGILIASAAILVARRRRFSPTRVCLIALETAYLANLELCLIVYSEATGSLASRSGWLISLIIVWPILFELIWFFILSLRTQAPEITPRAI